MDSAYGAADVAGSKAKAGKDATVDTAYGAADAVGSKAKVGKDAAADTVSGQILLQFVL